MSELLQKIGRYCAYQDRCFSEVRTKLRALECPEEDVDPIIDKLVKGGFIDEARFAQSFVRGKFKIKGWGKVKIRSHLKAKFIPEAFIQQAFKSEIKQKDYLNRLQQEIDKKVSSPKLLADFEEKQKLVRYLMQKGYEQGLILELLS